MGALAPEDVRAFIVASLSRPMAAVGLDPNDVPDDLDLMRSDVVDSLGMLELLAAIEDRFALEIDFEDADPEELTALGALCRRVAQQSTQAKQEPA